MNYQEPMFKAEELKGKTILVTGGGTGLGKSMSRYFMSLGAKVIIASRKQDVLDATAEELRKETGGEILAEACDVRKPLEVEKLIEKGVNTFGEINGLVNNAAGNFISPTERLSPKAFDVIVDIVLKGSYNCSLLMGQYWIKNKIYFKTPITLIFCI